MALYEIEIRALGRFDPASDLVAELGELLEGASGLVDPVRIRRPGRRRGRAQRGGRGSRSGACAPGGGRGTRRRDGRGRADRSVVFDLARRDRDRLGRSERPSVSLEIRSGTRIRTNAQDTRAGCPPPAPRAGPRGPSGPAPSPRRCARRRLPKSLKPGKLSGKSRSTILPGKLTSVASAVTSASSRQTPGTDAPVDAVREHLLAGRARAPGDEHLAAPAPGLRLDARHDPGGRAAAER